MLSRMGQPFATCMVLCLPRQNHNGNELLDGHWLIRGAIRQTASHLPSVPLPCCSISIPGWEQCKFIIESLFTVTQESDKKSAREIYFERDEHEEQGKTCSFTYTVLAEKKWCGRLNRRWISRSILQSSWHLIPCKVFFLFIYCTPTVSLILIF